MTTMTLGARLRDRERQRFFVTYLSGKMAGVALALLLVYSVGSFLMGRVAHADELQDQITSVVNATNTAWTLVATFLVFFMQAGFMALEDRKSTRLNSSHVKRSRMPSSA